MDEYERTLLETELVKEIVSKYWKTCKFMT